MQSLLTIAGFDPSSGAGVSADMHVFAAFGHFGTACLTALTVQSTMGVRRVEAVSADLLQESLECLTADIAPIGVKIGMLATEKNIFAVARFLEDLAIKQGIRVPVVLDPVLRSSSGAELLSEAGVTAMRERLLPLVDWVTPNTAELAVLLGGPASAEPAALVDAGRELQRRFGCRNIVVTGGELPEPNDLVIDENGTAEWVTGVRIETRATHGTGCNFSSALLCALVAGRTGGDAVRVAKEFVSGAMRHAETIGHGPGPLNAYWQWSDRNAKYTC